MRGGETGTRDRRGAALCSTRPKRSRGSSNGCRSVSGRSSSTTARPTAPGRRSRARRAVVDESEPGFGAACYAGLVAARPRSSASWTATRRSTPASSRGSPTRSRGAAPTSSLGADRRTRGLAAARTARQPCVAAAIGRRVAVPARPRPDAGRARNRPRSISSSDRRFGWPLEMVLAGRPSRLADHRGPRAVPRARRHEQGDRYGARHGARSARHRAGDAVHLTVIAKAPVPGRVKTRLCPPCTPEEAASIAEAAIADTLDACPSVAGPPVVVLDGERGPGCPTVSDRDPAVRRRPRLERLAAAFDDVGGPALLSAWTPHRSPAALLPGACVRAGGPGVDAVMGPAVRWWTGGPSACASRRPSVFAACR